MQRRFSAVIFDFGGVITGSPFEAFARFEAERGLPEGFIRRINATDPDSNAWARLERSEIDLTAFDALFAEEAAAMGHRVGGADVISLIAGEVRPEMVAALDRLTGERYRIGCITNNMRGSGGPGMARDALAASRYADVFARFEEIVESADSGLRKPDPRIYLLMCEKLGLQPRECVYLDDLGINCKPAAALGMHAIKVTNPLQALQDLSRILQLDLLG